LTVLPATSDPDAEAAAAAGLVAVEAVSVARLRAVCWRPRACPPRFAAARRLAVALPPLALARGEEEEAFARDEEDGRLDAADARLEPDFADARLEVDFFADARLDPDLLADARLEPDLLADVDDFFAEPELPPGVDFLPLAPPPRRVELLPRSAICISPS